MRKTIQNLFLVGISCLLTLLLVEVGLQLVGYYPNVQTPPYLFDNHPQTWWTLNPGFQGTIDTPDGLVTYAINSQGIRASREILHREDMVGRRLFIIGDSFAFGSGVNEEDTFVRVLNGRFATRDLDVEAVNLGVPGFGTRHAFDRLLEYSHKLGPPDYLIYLFTPNDPVDNVTGRKEVIKGIRIDSHRNYKELLAWVGHAYFQSRALALALDFYYTNFGNPRTLKQQALNEQGGNVSQREDFIATRQYLGRISAWAQQNGVKLAVVTVGPSEYSEPLQALTAEMGIPFADASLLANPFNRQEETVVLADGHWNARGHAFVALGLEKWLSELGWLE